MNRTTPNLAKELLLFLCVAAGYFYLHAHRSFDAYFSMDDLNNISWSHVLPYKEVILDALNPNTMGTVDTYRPVGALFYKIAYQLFGLEALGYHLMAHLLHFLNCILVYLFLRRLGCSALSALTGGLVFTFQLFTLPIYWEFSTIFDITCALFLFLSLILYIHATRGPGISRTLLAAASVMFFLAVRSKEMAFALPPLLTIHDILFEEKPSLSSILKKQWPFYVIAVCYALPKALAALSAGNAGPYGIVLSWNSFASGVAFYTCMDIADTMQCILLAFTLMLLCVLPVLLRDRRLQFALLYLFLSFAPIIFLQNHRWHAYWYIPEFGVALYAAGLVQLIRERVVRNSRLKLAEMVAALIAILCVNSWVSFSLKIHEENWYVDLGREYRGFITQLRASRFTPPEESTIVFSHAPRYFDDATMGSVLHLLYDDWSLTVKIDDRNPVARDPNTYYIDYQNGKVTTPNTP